MQFLVFRLYAPLASWGDVAVGEYRPSHVYPGRSALLGLIAAALGIDREDEAAHGRIDAALGFAVAIYEEGSLLRDYHTAQVAGQVEMKRRKAPPLTRADELCFPRHELNTILSTRDYRQDALAVVGAWLKPGRHDTRLEDIEAALRRPRFTLYLGRKSCPPALPMSPSLVDTQSFVAALEAANLPAVDGFACATELRRIASETPDVVGRPMTFSVPRKDAPLSRKRWQFGDRVEYVALIDAPLGNVAALDEETP